MYSNKVNNYLVIIQWQFHLEVKTDDQFDPSKPAGSDQGKNNFVKVYIYIVFIVFFDSTLSIIMFSMCFKYSFVWPISIYISLFSLSMQQNFNPLM